MLRYVLLVTFAGSLGVKVTLPDLAQKPEILCDQLKQRGFAVLEANLQRQMKMFGCLAVWCCLDGEQDRKGMMFFLDDMIKIDAAYDGLQVHKSSLFFFF